jgi:putative SOS response-associated peptidase YedK
LAGIWETRTETDGQQTRSFSLLTINAQSHPVMQRFHGLDDEKRSVVVVPTVDWEQWLAPRHEADLRALLQLFDPEEFVAEPRPRRPKAPSSAKTVMP